MGLLGNLKKRFKRRLRLKRRWLALGAVILVIGAVYAYMMMVDTAPYANVQEKVASVFSYGSRTPGSLEDLRSEATVTLHRLYMCGEDETSYGIMPPERIRELAAAHPEWEFAIVSAKKIVFTEHVGDLSDECKRNSYIGVDASGNLTLYEGPPKEERAVKTFFQLDIEHLESALPPDVVRQLREGIRITDAAEYNSVLSTFSDFAVEETEEVMKQGR